MAAERVDREALVEQVTQLATDHADLIDAVRALLSSPRRPAGDSVAITAPPAVLATLIRLADSP